jgi:hypothetical protein
MKVYQWIYSYSDSDYKTHIKITSSFHPEPEDGDLEGWDWNMNQKFDVNVPHFERDNNSFHIVKKAEWTMLETDTLYDKEDI